MYSKTKKVVGLLLVGIMLSACAVTLKQSALHMKRDWLEIREKVIVAYNEGKLDAFTALEFINVDEAFQVTYSGLVDKILSDGDVSEDEIAYLQGLITAWRDKIP
mgnify:CR=1 FL=1